MDILILGGGNVGGKLAADIEEPFTLIDADPSRIYELKLKFAEKSNEYKLIVGDGSDPDTLREAGGSKFDVAVILMNKDFENLEAARNLRDLGVERIIARVNRSSNMGNFTELGAEVFIHPVGYEEGLIKTMLFPDIKHALQIFVRDGSPAIDRSIMELNLPKGSVIGSILRGEELIPPKPDTCIQRGDLIAIDTVGKSAKEVLRRFSKVDKVESAGHILMPINRNMDLTAIKEAETLAKRLGSEIVLIVNPGTEKYLDYTKGFISKRVPIQVIASKGVHGEMFAEPYLRSVKIRQLPKENMELQNIMKEHMKEGSPHTDMMILQGPKGGFFYLPFLNTKLDYLIERASMPVLLSRTGRPYRNILVYISGSQSQDVSIAIQFARSMGSKITAVYQHRYRRRAQYLKRFAQVYKVDLELKEIQGNPTVELIKEVRYGNYDLIILKRRIRELQNTQVKRIIHLWNGSVMMVP